MSCDSENWQAKQKEYNTKPMGGKGENQFDYGDTLIPWEQVKPSGKTQIIPNKGLGNNPIFGITDSAARKTAIKAAKAEGTVNINQCHRKNGFEQK